MTATRLVVGLVGQACAGKSAVAAAFQRRGARVYDADRVVHGLYGREEVKAEVRRWCGGKVFTPAGEVDRGRLAAWAFSSPERLAALTGKVIFPRMSADLDRKVAAFRAATGPKAAPLLVLDAPTLFEAGRAGCCDRALFVSAPPARRARWAAQHRGWAPGELKRRERYMLDEAQKRACCNVVVENAGTLEDLDRRVAGLWSEWVEKRWSPAGGRAAAPRERTPAGRRPKQAP